MFRGAQSRRLYISPSSLIAFSAPASSAVIRSEPPFLSLYIKKKGGSIAAIRKLKCFDGGIPVDQDANAIGSSTAPLLCFILSTRVASRHLGSQWVIRRERERGQSRRLHRQQAIWNVFRCIEWKHEWKFVGRHIFSGYFWNTKNCRRFEFVHFGH